MGIIMFLIKHSGALAILRPLKIISQISVIMYFLVSYVLLKRHLTLSHIKTMTMVPVASTSLWCVRFVCVCCPDHHHRSSSELDTSELPLSCGWPEEERNITLTMFTALSKETN